jgi:hypothetical protein
VILIVGVLIWVIKTQNETIERLKFIETSVVEAKDIGNGILRSQSSYVTKEDLNSSLKKLNLEDIKKDLNTLGAEVKSIHTVHVYTPGVYAKEIPTTEDGEKNPNPTTEDKFGYLAVEQKLALHEPFSDKDKVPFGKVGFKAWEEKPWVLEIYPRKYRSITAIGENEDGRHYAYSRFEIDVNGKTHVVPISESKIIQEYPSKKFHWNPRIYLGIDGGVILSGPRAELTPNIGLSVLSYGSTKTSPDWSFMTLGVGYASQGRNLAFLLAPVNYNIAKHLPLMDNFHVGPSVSVDTETQIGVHLGGRVAF